MLNILYKKYFFDKNRSELLYGSLISFFIRILAVFSSYVFALLIARIYGASTLGLFTLTQTFLLVFSIFCRLGLDTASIKFVSEYMVKNNFNLMKDFYYKTLKLVIPISIILSLTLYFLSPYIGNVINDTRVEQLLKIISFAILPFSLLLIHSETFRGMKKIIHYSLFRHMSIPLIASIVLIIFYFNTKLDYKDPIYAYLISIFILTVISFLLWFKEMYKNKSSDSKEFLSFKKIINTSFPMMLTSSMAYLLNWTAIFILGIYVSSAEIGIYNIAMRISLLTSISLFAVNSIAAPKFSELYSKNNIIDFQKIIFETSKLMFWTSCPFLLLFLFFPEFFLNIFGHSFVVGKWTLIFLTIGQFINACSGSVGYILQMTGQQKIFQYVIFTSTVINILLNLFLIPKYGILGASLSNLVSISFWNITSIIIIKRKYNIYTFYIPFIRFN